MYLNPVPFLGTKGTGTNKSQTLGQRFTSTTLNCTSSIHITRARSCNKTCTVTTIKGSHIVYEREILLDRIIIAETNNRRSSCLNKQAKELLTQIFAHNHDYAGEELVKTLEISHCSGHGYWLDLFVLRIKISKM